MKHFILSSLIVLTLTTSAFAKATPKVICRNTSGLPSGLSVLISSQEKSGELFAKLTNRDNIGPFVTLGKIPVTREEYPEEAMGAPLTFIGPNFRLDISWDTSPDDGILPSYVDVTIRGRTFNEPMECELIDF